ncbi:PD-(D/E)XK nuclease family protein [uncultured Brachyspira sp.]|uniref:PD-(D/E)XK nuclease family protein n=1 Tax=uncultured Brachyspira sp. TaxID=221953 RepID=UPI002634E500|nr:PD-(D/E)XK nuclease family protein [uncultured Brachyspira sp.]
MLKTIIKKFQEDEKIKIKLFKHIISKKESIFEKLTDNPPYINIFNLISEQEKFNSQMLYDILKVNINKNIDVDNIKLNFAKLFIEFLFNKHNVEYKNNTLDGSKFEVKKEFQTQKNKFIDLLIWDNEKNYAVIIENKVNSGDNGENQIADYYNDIKNRKIKNIYVVYLTRYGYEPSENSLNNELKKEIGNNLFCIPHSFIASWLESILKDEMFIKLIAKEKDYKVLESAMIQFIQNENYLSGIEPDNKAINKILLEDENINKLYKSIEETAKYDEYIEIYNNAKDIISYKIRDKKLDILKSRKEEDVKFTILLQEKLLNIYSGKIDATDEDTIYEHLLNYNDNWSNYKYFDKIKTELYILNTNDNIKLCLSTNDENNKQKLLKLENEILKKLNKDIDHKKKLLYSKNIEFNNEIFNDKLEEIYKDYTELYNLLVRRR